MLSRQAARSVYGNQTTRVCIEPLTLVRRSAGKTVRGSHIVTRCTTPRKEDLRPGSRVTHYRSDGTCRILSLHNVRTRRHSTTQHCGHTSPNTRSGPHPSRPLHYYGFIIVPRPLHGGMHWRSADRPHTLSPQYHIRASFTMPRRPQPRAVHLLSQGRIGKPHPSTTLAGNAPVRGTQLDNPRCTRSRHVPRTNTTKSGTTIFPLVTLSSDWLHTHLWTTVYVRALCLISATPCGPRLRAAKTDQGTLFDNPPHSLFATRSGRDVMCGSTTSIAICSRVLHVHSTP